MLKNLYILKIDNVKILKKLIKYKIYFEKIINKENYIIIIVDYINYCNLLKYKEVFNIVLIDIKGINKYKYLLKKYFLFLISLLCGLIFIIGLSNVILDVKIMSNDKEIVKLLNNELNYHKVKKYSFVKSYKEKELIKKSIINDNKEKIEWLEITRSGSVYIINVERRIINNIEKDNSIRDVVSKKNAFIKEIKASNGSIIKKINDYVNKGEVIISGSIKKKEEIVNYVRAEGKVYGETWYNVKVTIPINYHEKIYTGKEKKRFTINFGPRKIKLFNFNNYKNEEVIEKKIIQNKILPISFNLDVFREIKESATLLTDEKMWDVAFNIAKTNLLNTLNSDSKILSQKKLKFCVKDSKIELDIFLKVYENITDYKIINIE